MASLGSPQSATPRRALMWRASTITKRLSILSKTGDFLLAHPQCPGYLRTAASSRDGIYPKEHQALIPPPSKQDESVRSWMDSDYSRSSDHGLGGRTIFCNRTLDLNQMQAIGFDMDYTLAQYKPETFEHLAYTQTVKHLCAAFGYPEVILHLDFDWQYMMRGLTIDKSRGNVIKVDRHKYVKVAFHGFSPMSKHDRQVAYSQGTTRLSFDTDDFTTIDTLFSLAEAYLFMQIVDLKDSGKYEMLLGKPYKDIYRDIRGAVDLCHRDGSLKTEVAANPAKFIHKDEQLRELLSMYRQAGRKVFLATNSLWDYTNVVMNFLVDGQEGNARNNAWLRYFDVVMTGCRKPGFFSERHLLFAVNQRDSTLTNTDNGAPILPIDKADMPSSMLGSPSLELEAFSGVKVFQGGCVSDLHSLLHVTNATSVLYVGDHIYGDILKSKKSMGWRTMLIVPELQMELKHAVKCAQTQRELEHLRSLRDVKDECIQRLHWQLRTLGSSEDEEEERQAVEDEMEFHIAERERVSRKHSERLLSHHQFFHPVWGQMLKTGYQNSMYANLMERFACLYTSHVSNLLLYSPYNKFRGRVDVMAHEMIGRGEQGKFGDDGSASELREVIVDVKSSGSSRMGDQE